MKDILIVSIYSYVIGSFQTAYIVAKLFKGLDIRELGNKNAGASNVTSTLGWSYGIIVALVDILKAFIAIKISQNLFQRADFNLSYISGLFVILGHNYPFYLSFRGGKGTASLIGMILALNIKLAIFEIVSMLIITIFTGYIALGTIFLLISFVIYTIYFRLGIIPILISFIITFLGIYKHRINIKNIKESKEISLYDTIRKSRKKS